MPVDGDMPRRSVRPAWWSAFAMNGTGSTGKSASSKESTLVSCVLEEEAVALDQKLVTLLSTHAKAAEGQTRPEKCRRETDN